jgi:RimJ/RimL family protein N-acetyltransferase
LIIRRYEERDIPFHAAYLFDSPKDFLEDIGFDTTKLGNRSEWESGVKQRRAEAAKKGEPPNVIIAEFGGRAISSVFLDRRNEDGVPRLHFHIFEPELRGKRLGGLIFIGGMKAISRIHNIQRFLIEPKASNQRMNGLMRNLGFRHIQDYGLAAGPVTQEMLVSQYEILVPTSIS